jgi:hypothetical protein
MDNTTRAIGRIVTWRPARHLHVNRYFLALSTIVPLADSDIDPQRVANDVVVDVAGSDAPARPQRVGHAVDRTDAVE